MNANIRSKLAEILSALHIDIQDVLSSVAIRGAERNREEIRALGARLPQIDDVDMADLTQLLDRTPTAEERLLVAQCMRVIAHAPTTITYVVWESRYSNEDFDRTQQLAIFLNEADKKAGRSKPLGGYETNHLRAKDIVSRANRYSAGHSGPVEYEV